MKHSEFKIGMKFTTALGERKWRCTDVGTRVIVCISLDSQQITVSDGKTQRHEITFDPSWHKGPPYAIAEYVMDEYDIRGCEPINN